MKRQQMSAVDHEACGQRLKGVFAFSSLFLKRMLDKKKQAQSSRDRSQTVKDFVWESVQNWGRRVELFEHSVIIVPVNDAMHWSIMFVCNSDQIVPRVVAAHEKQKMDKENAMQVDSDDGSEEIIDQQEKQETKDSKKAVFYGPSQRPPDLAITRSLEKIGELSDLALEKVESTKLPEHDGDSAKDDDDACDSASTKSETQDLAHSMRQSSEELELSRKKTTDQVSRNDDMPERCLQIEVVKPLLATSYIVNDSTDESDDSTKSSKQCARARPPEPSLPSLAALPKPIAAKADLIKHDDVLNDDEKAQADHVVNLLQFGRPSREEHDGSSPGGHRRSGTLEGGGKAGNDDLSENEDISDSSCDELQKTRLSSSSKPTFRSSSVTSSSSSSSPCIAALPFDSSPPPPLTSTVEHGIEKPRACTPQSAASGSSEDKSDKSSDASKTVNEPAVPKKGRQAKAKPLTMADLEAAKNRLDESREPVIICLDSLGVHSSKKHADILKLFLFRALDERLPAEAGIEKSLVRHKVYNMEVLEAPVPQQPNSFDCGVYVLQFVKTFLKKYVLDNDLTLTHTELNKARLKKHFGRYLFDHDEVAQLRQTLGNTINKKAKLYRKMKQKAENGPSAVADTSDDEVQIL